MPDQSSAPAGDEVPDRLRAASEAADAGRFDEALGLLEEILMEDPGHVAALEQVAEHELELGRLDRAAAAAEQAVALEPTSALGLAALGQVHGEREAWVEAIDHLQRANKLRSNDPEILRRLGWSLFRGGQRPQGVVTLERSLNLDPDNVFALCDLGVVYLELANYAKSKALFSRVLQLDPENERAHECLGTVQRLEKLDGKLPGKAAD
ncbi:MAG: tetratricopeptide repeat protein [Candidatus Peribacteraceae bacterium]|nr:tetratricopeptide repeat protein [Candidatus Peribacteraceae bacterium]